MMRKRKGLQIKRVTEWQYRPGEAVGLVHFFGWCLVVIGYRYFIDGREVDINGQPVGEATYVG